MKSILSSRQNQHFAHKLLFLSENLNKAFGYLRNLVISWVLGFGAFSDLYFLVFGITATVSGIINGAMNATFVPYSQKMRVRERRGLIGVCLLMSAFMLLAVTIPALLIIIPEAQPALRNLALTIEGYWIICGLLLGFICFQSVQIADDFSKSRQNFLFGAVFYFLINLSSIIILYFGLQRTTVALGWALAFPSLCAMVWIYGVMRLAKWNWYSGWSYVRQSWPLLISGSAGALNFFVDRWFASGFSEGQLSRMQTAFLLVTQIGSAFVSPLINSAYPYFSKLYSDGKSDEATQVISQLERKIVLLAFTFSIGFLLFGRKILAMIYQHGQVSGQDIEILFISGCYYLPVFIYGAFVLLFLRVMYCQGHVKTPAMLSASVIVLNILLNFLLIDRLSWITLPLSASFCAWCYFLILTAQMMYQRIYIISKNRMLLMHAPIAIYLLWVISQPFG